MEMMPHGPFQSGESGVASAMTSTKMSLWVFTGKSISQSHQILFCLMSIKQVETSYDHLDGPRTSVKNIFQPTMGAPREQQTVSVKSQFVLEIIRHIIARGILNEQVAITLRHWVMMGNMGNDMEAIGNLT